MWYNPTAYARREEVEKKNTEPERSVFGEPVTTMIRDTVARTRASLTYRTDWEREIVNQARRYDDMHSLRVEGFIKELRRAA
jgi:hypothetical protein